MQVPVDVKNQLVGVVEVIQLITGQSARNVTKNMGRLDDYFKSQIVMGQIDGQGQKKKLLPYKATKLLIKALSKKSKWPVEKQQELYATLERELGLEKEQASDLIQSESTQKREALLAELPIEKKRKITELEEDLQVLELVKRRKQLELEIQANDAAFKLQQEKLRHEAEQEEIKKYDFMLSTSCIREDAHLLALTKERLYMAVSGMQQEHEFQFAPSATTILRELGLPESKRGALGMYWARRYRETFQEEAPTTMKYVGSEMKPVKAYPKEREEWLRAEARVFAQGVKK